MTFGSQGAVSAARHSIVQPDNFRPRALALGLLLSSVGTGAVAQTTVPGSTNTPQQEQTTAPNAPGAQPPSPQASDVANPASGAQVVENGAQAPQDQGLGAIIVTATKRETNLQKTPIAISVANTQALTDRHADSLLDLGDGSIPSLRVATFEARQSALTVGIRGIVPFDQNQTARDAGVGVYIDGVYLARAQGLNAGLLDIDRIEVLRGPQGTLFGRNTEGGAVSIITRAPTGQFGLRGTIGAGNYGQRQGAIHLDLPAVADFAVKVDAIYDHQDETVKNPLSGQKGWNYHNVVGGRVAGRWTPVDGLTVDLFADYTKDENTPNYSQLINYNPLNRTVGQYIIDPTLVNPNPASASSYILVAPGTTTKCSTCIAPLSPLVVVSGDHRQKEAEIGVPQQVSVDRTHGFGGTIKYKVSPSLELRSITAWRGVTTHQWDNSGGAHRTIFAPFANFSRYSLSELFQDQFSQEFQIVGSLPSFDYVLGAYYFNEDVEEAAATPSTNKWNVDGTAYIINSENGNGIPQPPFISGNQGWNRENWFVQRHSTAKAKSYAAFGQATWTPAGFDAFHLTAGARWTHDKRDGVLDVVNGNPTAGGAAVLPVPFTFHFRKSRIDPMVTAAFDATPDIHLYAKYSTGYRAGGANDRSATFRSFGPEIVKAYEAGAKLDLFDHLARLNLAGYLMRRTGTQTDFDFVDTNTASPTFNLHTEETINAPGVSKIKGIEADLTVRPVRNLTLGASYAYTDVKVPVAPNPLPGVNFGKPTPIFTVFTPKHAAAGYIDYEIPAGFAGAKLRAHVDANYAGRQYSFQAESIKTDSSFIVNARLALADIEMNEGSTLLTFALWSRNLLNETHIYRISGANEATLGDYGNFNPPRTWGAELSFKIGAPHHVEPYVAPPAPPPPPAASVTCESGVVIAAPRTCPPPPPPASQGERGN
jgi:iron complex outermembrane receptor protein